MGYTVNGGGTFTVKEGAEADCLAALKTHTREVMEVSGHYPWANTDVLLEAETVLDWWAEVLQGDDQGDRTIYVNSYDSWAQEYDAAAVAMGPFIEPGTDCEWMGEDDSAWCWRFTGTECIEEHGQVVYGSEAFALDRIAAVLHGREWDWGHVEEVAEILRETGRTIGPPEEGARA